MPPSAPPAPLGTLKAPFSSCCSARSPTLLSLSLPQHSTSAAYIAKELGRQAWRASKPAPMAAIDAVVPAPPVVPVVRISRLTVAAADAVVCLWIASLWLFLASFAAALIVSLAYGLGCPVVGAAWKAVLVSLLFDAIVWPLAALLLSRFVEPFYTNQLKKGAAALEPVSEAVIGVHLFASTALAILEGFGALLKLVAAKESPTDRIASVIMAVPPLGIVVMCCFVSIPVLAVRVWRARRHGSASVVPI